MFPSYTQTTVATKTENLIYLFEHLRFESWSYWLKYQGTILSSCSYVYIAIANWTMLVPLLSFPILYHLNGQFDP